MIRLCIYTSWQTHGYLILFFCSYSPVSLIFFSYDDGRILFYIIVTVSLFVLSRVSLETLHSLPRDKIRRDGAEICLPVTGAATAARAKESRQNIH